LPLDSSLRWNGRFNKILYIFTHNCFNEARNKRSTLMSTEKYTIDGSQLVEKVKQLIREGNIRRVRILHEGQTVLEIPLTIGAPAAALTIMIAPVLAALGAFAALVTECTIEVEKVEEKKPTTNK
jgi:Domain of unknown function (DUF4342)